MRRMMIPTIVLLPRVALIARRILCIWALAVVAGACTGGIDPSQPSAGDGGHAGDAAEPPALNGDATPNCRSDADCPAGSRCEVFGADEFTKTRCVPRGSDGGVDAGCARMSCQSQGYGCGTAADGCGGSLDCGQCTAPQTCGGGGTPHQCGLGCTPTSCQSLGYGCGTAADGCGGSLDCGQCTAPQTCGGGGTPHQCGVGCATACTGGQDCGTQPDGCGGTVTCGTCTAPQTCGGGGVPNRCGGSACTPQPGCELPATPAGSDVQFAPEFALLYAAYDLGPVPGAPTATLLGGMAIRFDDRNRLLIGVDSERATGAIYEVGVRRNACGHIVAFEGSATKVADAPYVDANLVYAPGNVLFYTQWPINKLSQLTPGSGAASSTTDLAALGVGGGGPGGIGFVPAPLADAGGLRILTWSAGDWYHLSYTALGGLFAISAPVKTTTLPNGPGGFAYVPAASPGFTSQSLIVAEWSVDSVAVYEVDSQGDPLPATRRSFFTHFPRPWGAYFEPLTGDYVFLTWGAGQADRVYIVQGFCRPAE